jgi:hypothetical protein
VNCNFTVYLCTKFVVFIRRYKSIHDTTWRHIDILTWSWKIHKFVTSCGCSWNILLTLEAGNYYFEDNHIPLFYKYYQWWILNFFWIFSGICCKLCVKMSTSIIFREVVPLQTFAHNVCTEMKKWRNLVIKWRFPDEELGICIGS